MIGELDIYPMLENEFPLIRSDLRMIDDVKSPYKLVRCFGNFTMLNLKKGELKASKKCFVLAERIFEEGDGSVRQAIENVFLHLLTPGIETHQFLISETSPLLLSEYKMQVPSSAGV